jgi:hypothetical protein
MATCVQPLVSQQLARSAPKHLKETLRQTPLAVDRNGRTDEMDTAPIGKRPPLTSESPPPVALDAAAHAGAVTLGRALFL